MNCEECKIKRALREGEAWRQHQVIKWLIVIIALLICLLVGSNVAWLYYESQFEDKTVTTTQEVTQDADSGTNNFIGGDSYGQTDGKNDDHNQNPHP